MQIASKLLGLLLHSAALRDFGQALSHLWQGAQAGICSLHASFPACSTIQAFSSVRAWPFLCSEGVLEPCTQGPELDRVPTCLLPRTHSLGLGCSSTSVCLRIRSVQFLVLSARARRFSK